MARGHPDRQRIAPSIPPAVSPCRAFSPHARAKKLARAAECLVHFLTPSGVLAENHPKNRGFVGILRGQKCLKRGQKCLRRRFSRRSPVGEWSRGARSMPRVFGRGSRRQPAALVSDQPIPASTGIWCRQEMACSGKPCRQSANLTPVPCSSTSKRSPLASTNSVYISGIQHIDLIRQYRGAGIDLLINGDRNDGETRELFASDVMPHLA